MICAHMGGWRMWDASEAHLIGQEIDQIAWSNAAKLLGL